MLISEAMCRRCVEYRISNSKEQKYDECAHLPTIKFTISSCIAPFLHPFIKSTLFFRTEVVAQQQHSSPNFHFCQAIPHPFPPFPSTRSSPSQPPPKNSHNHKLFPINLLFPKLNHHLLALSPSYTLASSLLASSCRTCIRYCFRVSASWRVEGGG